MHRIVTGLQQDIVRLHSVYAHIYMNVRAHTRAHAHAMRIRI